MLRLLCSSSSCHPCPDQDDEAGILPEATLRPAAPSPGAAAASPAPGGGGPAVAQSPSDGDGEFEALVAAAGGNPRVAEGDLLPSKKESLAKALRAAAKEESALWAAERRRMEKAWDSASRSAVEDGTSRTAEGWCRTVDLFTVTFLPGEVGLLVDTDTGIVNSVFSCQQADRLGVRPGYVMRFLDGVPFEPSLFEQRTLGRVPYIVTFERAVVDGSLIEPYGVVWPERRAVSTPPRRQRLPQTPGVGSEQKTPFGSSSGQSPSPETFPPGGTVHL